MVANNFDIIVIGAGHAGAEAAHAAARLGANTLLVTISKETIAKASCNPAIGGLGKGQLVCEIDALGGMMGIAADATGIQFRMLNRSKGPAVQSPRAQIDKYLYSRFIRRQLEETPNLAIAEKMAAEILTENNAVSGIRCTDGSTYKCPCVIVTTGTFLKGVMHIGEYQWPGGRLDEPAANELSDSLRAIGLEVLRLKTGTPPRLDGATVDYDRCEIQQGDAEPQPFSFMTDKITRKQLPCWITWTNREIHKLLTDNLHRAPLYCGQIQSTGPRYCPSIETKIQRFAEKTRHQVFLEPEDEKISTIYCNGISTSVPKDIQQKMLQLMAGTENARIVHYAYAIEYDYCPAVQLNPGLETKKISGLFLAGQINGTSGYEEAAAQGLMAGINAVLKLRGKEPFIITRQQAYIGVLIDDLITRRMDEPYRMFTSRAEYRLSLRADNADRRLTPPARQLGLVSNERWSRFEQKLAQIKQLETLLQATKRQGKSLWQLLGRSQNDISSSLADEPLIKQLNLPQRVIETTMYDAKYQGYLEKQDRLVAAFKKLENIKLPANIDYSLIPHLRAEAKEKLMDIKPATLGQAGRIGGITPSDITILQIYLKKMAGK